MTNIVVFLVSHGRFSKVNQVFFSDQIKKNQTYQQTTNPPPWMIVAL